jgi:glycosyltransferase involved in cell wall biosynthesis
MPKVYRSGDVLVLPSRAEGVPRTVLEAMASGLEIVMSDLDQVSSLVEERGETVDSDNPKSYGKAILRCLADSDRTGEIVSHKMSQYEWEGTIQRTTNVLQQLYSDSEA